MNLAFLMLQSMKSNGGVGYVNTEVVEILPETQVQFNNNDGIVAMAKVPLVVGKTYDVLWDGEKYKCTCTEQSDEGMKFAVLGNLSPFGGADTGEPFMAMAIDEGLGYYQICIVPAADDNDHTCSIMGEAETIHPIDPKFLPASAGGGLPVVKLTTVIDPTASTELTAAESAALTKAIQQKTPFIVDVMLSMQGMQVEMFALAAVMDYTGIADMGVDYVAAVDMIVTKVQITKQPGSEIWTVEEMV